MTRGSVRLRLTALYSGLFLGAAAIVLGLVYLLLRRMLRDWVADLEQATPGALPSLPAAQPGTTAVPTTVEHTEVVSAVGDLSDAVLRFQWGTSLAAVAALTVAAALAGWWLSGRLLRPLRRITETARRLSLSNLEERIGLAGPPNELKDLADTFDTMAERLRRSTDGQRHFVANAAHELRTPLATQRALIQIGLEDPTPERVARTRADLLEANRRTERLINGLLILAQAEHGMEDAEPVPLDQVVAQAAAEATPHRVALTVRSMPVTVYGDPVLLHRLVANLLDNAHRYNRPDGTIQVDLSDEAVLTIRNTGPDVPRERLDELFRPFSRLHEGRPASRDGTGLGLSIVAAIAKAHDAEVAAEPNPDGGLTVTIRFPPPTNPSTIVEI